MTDEESYRQVLVNNGITEEEVQKQVRIKNVTVNTPYVYVRKSEIHGQGLFSKYSVAKGKIICPARVGEQRTIAGRYANHSANPNASYVLMGRTFVLVATRHIQKDEEVTLNYQQVIDVNKEVK